MKNCQGVRTAPVTVGCCVVLTPLACAESGYPEWADPLSVGCYNSHNASSPTFTDWSVEGRWDRQWVWMLCNEPFAFWQKLVNLFLFLRARLTTYSGPPPFHRGLMSRVVSTDYFQRQCELMFPPTPNGTTYGSADGVRTTNTLNQLTGGWNFGNTTRVLWTVGYVLFSPAEQSRANGGTASSTPGAMPRSPVLFVQAARWPLLLPVRYS